MNSYTISDYDIQAFVDDELPYEEAKKVLSYIERNPDAHKRYQELINQKNILKLWWGKINSN